MLKGLKMILTHMLKFNEYLGDTWVKRFKNHFIQEQSKKQLQLRLQKTKFGKKLAT
tara:strand:+ start:402 stop:569 length:168 start_codon:yes stop_codon:yes gene_type:complete